MVCTFRRAIGLPSREGNAVVCLASPRQDPQLRLAGSPEKYRMWVASAGRVEGLSGEASRGHGAAPRAPGRCGGLRRSLCAEPTRWRGTAGPRANWGVRRWRWRCAARWRKREKLAGERSKTFSRVTPSGMPCSCLRFSRGYSSCSATSPPKRLSCSHRPRRTRVPTLQAACRLTRPRVSASTQGHGGCGRVPEDRGLHKGANWGPFYPLSRNVGSARAEALAEDQGKARIAFQDFLALWKDADPDSPVLVQARKESAALRCKRTTSPSFMIALSRYHGTL